MRHIILHNIRSAYNVGSIFRTAEGAGVENVYLSGYTPTPTDRFGRKRKDISKVALGAEDIVKWEKCEDIDKLISKLKEKKMSIIAVEQTKKSLDYRDFKEPKSVVYIFGNEVEGIEDEVLVLADSIIEIPMRGEKKSLNVSVSAGIILFQN